MPRGFYKIPACEIRAACLTYQDADELISESNHKDRNENPLTQKESETSIPLYEGDVSQN